ncbi:hypothetical protein J2S17_000339 [Cytobacillus purgationiresistens]|uniref:Uncharacterized protein n=1 Tax=Cytobacillus purgationiresistens TaxID=863449 RepID=A0ABU0ABQ1_9BACI|nr:hypothetical protein [Cytobacillus purgationiresistens]
MSLHIGEVSEDNWREVASLEVAKSQQQFIERNAFSLAESQYEKLGKSVALNDNEPSLAMRCLVGQLI